MIRTKSEKVATFKALNQDKIIADFYNKEASRAYLALNLGKSKLPPINEAPQHLASSFNPLEWNPQGHVPKPPPRGLKKAARGQEECPFSRIGGLSKGKALVPIHAESSRIGEHAGVRRTEDTPVPWKASQAEMVPVPPPRKHHRNNTLLGEEAVPLKPPPRGLRRLAGPPTAHSFFG